MLILLAANYATEVSLSGDLVKQWIIPLALGGGWLLDRYILFKRYKAEKEGALDAKSQAAIEAAKEHSEDEIENWRGLYNSVCEKNKQLLDDYNHKCQQVTDLSLRIQICMDERTRLENKANEVATLNANLAGQVDRLLRTQQDLTDQIEQLKRQRV